MRAYLSRFRLIDLVGVLVLLLSVGHIHDLVVRKHHTGWQADAYAVIVDLMMVGGYQSVVEAREKHTKSAVAWLLFLFGTISSMAANYLDSEITSHGDPLGIAIGVWPSVALIVVTVRRHAHEVDPEPEAQHEQPEGEAPEEPVVPAPAAPPVPAAYAEVVEAIRELIAAEPGRRFKTKSDLHRRVNSFRQVHSGSPFSYWRVRRALDHMGSERPVFGQ